MAHHHQGFIPYVVFFVIIASVTCHPSPAEEEPSYEGFQVLRLRAENNEILLADTVKGLEQTANVDVWSRTRRYADVMVAPEHLRYVRETSASQGIQSDVVVDDVRRFLERDFDRRQSRSKRSVRDVTNSYLTFTEINEYLQRVARTASAADVTLSNIGKSFENKVVPMVELKAKGSRGDKQAILIDAGIHAREWMAVAMAMNIIHKLAFNPDNDPDVNELLEKFDWYVVPVINPDGYEYSHGSAYTRLWRKTRTTQYHSRCRGVDGNRNFGYDWNPAVGGSRDPCQEVYAGPYAFSEPETRNIQNWLTKHKSRGVAYITLHAFGEWLLYPYGSNMNKFLADKSLIESVADAFKTALAQKGRLYEVGNSARLLYPAAGGSDDYAKGALGIPVSFTLEISPKSTAEGGFRLAEGKVSRVAQDTWAGIEALVKRLHEKLTEEKRDGNGNVISHNNDNDNTGTGRNRNNNNNNNIFPNNNSNRNDRLMPITWHGFTFYVDPNNLPFWLRQLNIGK